MRVRLLAGALTCVSLIGVLLFHDLSNASAAASCPGTVVKTINLKAKGKADGHIKLYYDSVSKKNCAILYRDGQSKGVSGETTLTMTPAGKSSVTDSDKKKKNKFESYAGPVSAVSPKCVRLQAKITTGSDTVTYDHSGWCDGVYKRPAMETVASVSPAGVPSWVTKGVKTALAQKGKAYHWGGTGPNSFDCSGLVVYSFGTKRAGGRTTYSQQDNAKMISAKNAKPGDLVFYGGNNPHHVGIYIGKGKMIHAANPSAGVKISSVNSQKSSPSYGRIW